MLIDLKDGILSFQDSELKSSQKSQLNYWGFKRNEKGYQVKIGDDGKLLKKIVNFFADENTPISLSSSCQELLNKEIALFGYEY